MTHKEEILNCWVAEIQHQTRMVKHSTIKITAVGFHSSSNTYRMLFLEEAEEHDPVTNCLNILFYFQLHNRFQYFGKHHINPNI